MSEGEEEEPQSRESDWSCASIDQLSSPSCSFSGASAEARKVKLVRRLCTRPLGVVQPIRLLRTGGARQDRGAAPMPLAAFARRLHRAGRISPP